MIMRQKANSHNIWAHYKSLGQEIGLCHNSRVRTAPQLMISGSTQKHMDTPTHTHTNSDEKLYISFCVPPRLSLSLSLLPFNTPPSQCNPPFKRMSSSPPPNSNLLFQPNSAAQSFLLFSPQVPQQTSAHFFSTFQNLSSKQTNRLLHHNHHRRLSSSSATHTWDLFCLLMWTCQAS